MPIAPRPTTFECAACDWAKTIAPGSDALAHADYPSACPACGHAPLVVRPANATEARWAIFLGLLSRKITR